MEASGTGCGCGTSRKNFITCRYPILTQAIIQKFFNQNPLLAANITFLVVVLQAKGNMLYKERGM
jgi:hypothetical protein